MVCKQIHNLLACTWQRQQRNHGSATAYFEKWRIKSGLRQILVTLKSKNFRLRWFYQPTRNGTSVPPEPLVVWNIWAPPVAWEWIQNHPAEPQLWAALAGSLWFSFTFAECSLPASLPVACLLWKKFSDLLCNTKSNFSFFFVLFCLRQWQPNICTKERFQNKKCARFKTAVSLNCTDLALAFWKPMISRSLPEITVLTIWIKGCLPTVIPAFVYNLHICST